MAVNVGEVALEPRVSHTVALSMAEEIIALRKLTNEQAQQIVVLSQLLENKPTVPS